MDPARSSARTAGQDGSDGSRPAQPVLQAALERLTAAGLTPDEIRRLFEAELLRLGDRPRTRKS